MKKDYLQDVLGRLDGHIEDLDKYADCGWRTRRQLAPWKVIEIEEARNKAIGYLLSRFAKQTHNAVDAFARSCTDAQQGLIIELELDQFPFDDFEGCYAPTSLRLDSLSAHAAAVVKATGDGNLNLTVLVQRSKLNQANLIRVGVKKSTDSDPECWSDAYSAFKRIIEGERESHYISKNIPIGLARCAHFHQENTEPRQSLRMLWSKNPIL
jgi:hypothetical protein